MNVTEWNVDQDELQDCEALLWRQINVNKNRAHNWCWRAVNNFRERITDLHARKRELASSFKPCARALHLLCTQYKPSRACMIIPHALALDLLSPAAFARSNNFIFGSRGAGLTVLITSNVIGYFPFSGSQLWLDPCPMTRNSLDLRHETSLNLFYLLWFINV